MADIAMLVAEEYERRVKSTASRGGADVHDDDQMMMMLMIKKYKIDFNWVAERIKNNTHTFADNYKWLLEPKSQIGLAASNGVFSA